MNMKILGIDPGSSRLGYGLIEKRGSQLKFLKAGTLEVEESDPNQKLLYLAKDLKKIMANFRPSLVAIEKIYFSKNVKTAIEVAQARGLIIFLVLDQQIPIVEISPQQAKSAVTSYGAADKGAVAKMVSLLLNRPNLKELDDATDALAIAIAGAGLYKGCITSDTSWTL